MDDPNRMSLSQRIRDLNGLTKHVFDGQSFGPNQLVERFARHVLHRDEPHSFVLVHLIHGANIGMVQSGSRARFALKTLQRPGVVGKLFRQELERNGASQPGVFGLVNHPHGALTQFPHYAVVGDGAALGFDGHGLGLRRGDGFRRRHLLHANEEAVATPWQRLDELWLLCGILQY